MAQKKRTKKVKQTKQRIKIEEIPRPTKLLTCMAIAVIMLSGYGIISNILHIIALNEKVEIDYSSITMVELKKTLHEMNTDLIRLNEAKGSYYLTDSEFQTLKKSFNDMIEQTNQLSYITKIGKEKISQKEVYDFYLENKKFLFYPMIQVHRILQKTELDYQLTHSAFQSNIKSMMTMYLQLSDELYYNFLYTSFDDSKVLGSVYENLNFYDITSQSTMMASNYVQMLSTMLKQTLNKGGLYYE